jgi:integral membrane protein (TIGR01906 family)
MKKFAAVVGLVLVTLVVPFFLIMTSIRILLIPYIFVDTEYSLPGFPSDSYGFTQADRLKWSHVSIDYMLNDQPIAWLANQRLPDGNSLYNERELSHMLDVKVLIQAMFSAWWVLLAFLVVAGIAAWQLNALKRFILALSNGGWLTLILVATILVFVAISFNWLFTEFHRIFFTGDTWLFLYTDSLIRLFPIQFWQDAFIAMGSFTLLFAVLIGYFGRRWAIR